jgi:hypothetical protein
MTGAALPTVKRVTDAMLRAARSKMRPFVPPNDETLREAIAAALMVDQLDAEEVREAAHSFMELFVADNGDERCLSLDGIDHAELKHRYAKLEGAMNGCGDLPQAPWPASDWAIQRIRELESALESAKKDAK